MILLPTITGDQKENWQFKTSIVENKFPEGGGRGRGMEPECLIHPPQKIFLLFKNLAPNVRGEARGSF